MMRETVRSLADALRKGQVSSLELTEAFLDVIRERDGELGAFLSVHEEDARNAARAFDALPADQKWQSPLSGIPTAVKDNLMVAGKPATCGSKMLAEFVSPYDATVVERLKQAGAVLVGKTNMDEFGMGSTTEHSAFRITRNPLDPSRVPGGSSGGSAAAVAAGMVPFALGSDTGGSVRQPAAYCGVVGMRPTYGAVSRYGLTAFCSSMDTVGPITKTVYDNYLVMQAIVGRDERDATCRAGTLSLPEMPSRLRIGIIAELMDAQIADGVREAVWYTAKRLEAFGASVQTVTVPCLQSALSAYYVISSAQASSNLARFDGVRYGKRAENCQCITDLYRISRSEGFGDEVKRRILLGTYALTKEQKEAYYEQSMAIKNRITAAFDAAFAEYDILLCPTTPDVAPLLHAARTVTDMYKQDICTVPMSLAGLPALSMPAGMQKDGMPIGVQLVGKRFSEGLLYRVGMLLEREEML